MIGNTTEQTPLTARPRPNVARETPDLPLVELRPAYACAKRALDLLVATLALLITLPILAVAAVLIKLTSPGPVLFCQTRVGRGGRHFTCYKLRSMVVDAEKRRKQLAGLNEASGPVFKIRNDPRVTAVGRFIRKFSIDELPQLWNVIVGDMTLVGPRPPLPLEVAQYGVRARRRLSVTPGLTCLWQIGGRSNVSFEHWVELDIAYIEHMSFWEDVRILVLTVPAVLTARGAH